jgi:hypothetical protein
VSQDDNHKSNGGGRPLNGFGEADSPQESEPPPEELEPMPANVAELCAACVRFVTTKYGVILDFSPDTLSLVDQYIRDARPEILAKPESIDLLQVSIGAYLGEVIRRAHHGMWAAEGEYDTWRVMMTRVYLAFNPIGMVREALQLGEAPGWAAHLETDPGERDALDERLAALPEVEDDEFYAPTTRFDIVEIAVEALAAQMRDSGLGDVRFSREDYASKR